MSSRPVLFMSALAWAVLMSLQPASAEIEATTKDGVEVLLFEDGTWTYRTPGKSSQSVTGKAHAGSLVVQLLALADGGHKHTPTCKFAFNVTNESSDTVAYVLRFGLYSRDGEFLGDIDFLTHTLRRGKAKRLGGIYGSAACQEVSTLRVLETSCQRNGRHILGDGCEGDVDLRQPTELMTIFRN